MLFRRVAQQVAGLFAPGDWHFVVVAGAFLVLLAGALFDAADASLGAAFM
jgi:hypothetical protein